MLQIQSSASSTTPIRNHCTMLPLLASGGSATQLEAVLEELNRIQREFVQNHSKIQIGLNLMANIGIYLKLRKLSVSIVFIVPVRF